MLNTQPNKFNDYFFLRDGQNTPSMGSLVVRLFNLKATVIYYCLVTPDPGNTIFDYRFTILYPDNHYEQGSYKYDFETPFVDYITQYVQCKFAVYYTPSVPQLKEAVIFNHI